VATESASAVGVAADDREELSAERTCPRLACSGQYRDTPGHRLFHANNDRWRELGL
jgi:hypothetical protein